MGMYDEIEDVRKFNPFHGLDGKFTSGPGGGKGGIGGSVDTSKPPKGTKVQKDHLDGTFQGPAGIQRIIPASDEEAERYYSVVDDYTTSDYGDIREAGFYGSPPSSQRDKRRAEVLDDMISKAPKFDGEVYRGICVSEETARQIYNFAKDGHIINQMGASSFTTDEGTAKDFIVENAPDEGIGVLFKSKGVHNGTSVRHISRYPGEDEVLMSSKARWKPTGKNDWTIIDGVMTFIIECEPFWGDEDAYERSLS